MNLIRHIVIFIYCEHNANHLYFKKKMIKGNIEFICFRVGCNIVKVQRAHPGTRGEVGM